MTTSKRHLRGAVRRFLPAWRQYMMVVVALSDDPQTVDELARAALLSPNHVEAVLPKMFERKEVERYFLGQGAWGWSLTPKGEEIKKNLLEHGPSGLPSWVQPKVPELGEEKTEPLRVKTEDPISELQSILRRQLRERGTPVKTLDQTDVTFTAPGRTIRAFLKAKRT